MQIIRRAIVASGLVAIAAMSMSPWTASHAAEKLPSGTVAVPDGANPALYRIPGVRASPTLGTAVHCTNLELSATSTIVTFYEFDGTSVCTIMSSGGSGTTRTLTTGATAAFAEDAVCSPVPTIGQGYAVVTTSPPRANVICSAEIVSLSGTAPTTLGALDVYRAP